jgi:hypothetical protein
MPPASPRPRRRPRIRLRSAVIGAAALSAAAAAPALAAFTLDGSIANVPGNLQPASEPSVVLGGLKGHGSARVPWIAQVEPNAGGGPTQVFVEKLAGGQFSLQGESLNFNPAEPVTHPDIDFAGANFSVPWTAWEEDAGGVSQIFASRFLPNADLQNGVWEINGALRGSVASPGAQRGPSLNFNPDKGADEPRVHGGSLQATGTPAPWVIWKEQASVPGIGEQIFVTKGVNDSQPGPAQKGRFTWHIQGTDRGTSPAQAAQLGPTLNVQISPTVDAVHPDITFTGKDSTVPWAVWYEEPNNLPAGGVAAAPNNQRVFAAKFVPDATLGDRGGRWVPVGNGATCAFGTGAEDPNACALNKDGAANAENPNVAAGSLNPANPTVPWVAWHESTGTAPGKVFVSRLIPAQNVFQIFPGPNPDGSVNADPSRDADEPDLFFEGNVLHVTWKETTASGKLHAFQRTFTPGANGAGGRWSDAEDLQVDPTQDAGNPGIGAFGGSPFVTWAEGTGDPTAGHTLLKHDPATEQAQTLAPSAITTTSARLNAAAAGDPGVFAASFDVTDPSGTRTVSAGDVTHNAPDASQPFGADLTGLAPNSIVRVRAKLATALGTITGPEQDFVTAGSGAPGAVGLPPTPAQVQVKPAGKRVHRVRVVFTLSRKWKVTIKAHRGTRTGRVVASRTAKFHKGRNVAFITIPGAGRFVITITPRAGAKRQTVVRTVRL